MPYEPTSPADESVPVPTTKTLDTFHICEIHIEVDPNNQMATKATIVWCEGYMDDTTYVEVHRHTNVFAGAAFLTKMASTTEDGDSYYAAVKRGFWDHMVDEGIVPAGSMT